MKAIKTIKCTLLIFIVNLGIHISFPDLVSIAKADSQNRENPLDNLFDENPNFETFKTRLEEMGFDTENTVPKDNNHFWSPIRDNSQYTFTELYFSRQVDKYIQASVRVEAVNKDSGKLNTNNGLSDYLYQQLQTIENSNNELMRFRRENPRGFERLIERIGFDSHIKCDTSSSDSFSLNCSGSFVRLKDIRKFGLSADDFLRKIFSDPKGPLSGIRGLKRIKESNKFKATPPDEIGNEDLSHKINSNQIQSQEDCNLKALQDMRDKVKIARAGLSNHIWGNSATDFTACTLINLTFSIDPQTQKRTLIKGELVDLNGKSKTLTQTEFDEALKKMGILKPQNQTNTQKIIPHTSKTNNNYIKVTSRPKPQKNGQ